MNGRQIDRVMLEQYINSELREAQRKLEATDNTTVELALSVKINIIKKIAENLTIHITGMISNQGGYSMKYTEATREHVLEIFAQPKGFVTGIDCPYCGGHMVVREGYSKFLGCSNFPKCDAKMGASQPFERGDMVGLHNAAFSNSSGLNFDKCEDRGSSDWEEDITDAYPNGIHCADDM